MINQLNAANPITDDQGRMTQIMRAFTTQVTKSGLLIGTGSPEGVVTADQGREYMDDAGVAGAIKYIKRDPDDGAGDATKGWILV
jgi:hypothetical protein